ncbi:hypothetical protein GOP47_0010631 [Adiantum capillus-veneris]|uniref:Uncharacterized protein n=1 Tax=Adiantum capillus-veneris TaxID=13818 RepID=A0A9D4UUX2_ADICA|nr:hypothetical protein GOP47_0010631 [Adiantum capillus-veneris]
MADGRFKMTSDGLPIPQKGETRDAVLKRIGSFVGSFTESNVAPTLTHSCAVGQYLARLAWMMELPVEFVEFLVG